jgi:hypothetical protein
MLKATNLEIWECSLEDAELSDYFAIGTQDYFELKEQLLK